MGRRRVSKLGVTMGSKRGGEGRTQWDPANRVPWGGRHLVLLIMVACFTTVCCKLTGGRNPAQIERRRSLVDREEFSSHMHELRQLITDSTTFKCTGCLRESDGSPMQVRLMYIDTMPFVQNPTARKRAEELGVAYSCDNPKLALPECFKAKNWNSGWIGEMMSDIISSIELNVTTLTRANFSKEVYEVYKGGSSYTRCVWEVRLGNVDACIGDFWETEERRKLVAFTSAMDSDVLKLGTLSKGKVSELRLFGIFDPFEAELWGLSAAMILVASILLWYVEHDTPYNSDYFCQLEKDRHLSSMEGIGKSLWLGLIAYVFGEPAAKTTTWPGRMILLGFGWFVYISGSSYTANLASFMIAPMDSVGLISSFSDIAKKGGAICLLESLEAMVSMTGMEKRPYDDFIPALEGLAEGKCLGVMVGRNEWKILVQGGQGSSTVCIDPKDGRGYSSCSNPDGPTKLVQVSGCKCKTPGKIIDDCPEDCPDNAKYCNVVEVYDDDFQVYVNVALPTSPKLQDQLSAWIIARRQDGSQRRLKFKYIDAVYNSVCDDIDMTNSEAVPLNLNAMAGTFVVSGILVFGGFVWHLAVVYLDYKNIKVFVMDEKKSIKPDPLEDAHDGENGDGKSFPPSQFQSLASGRSINGDGSTTTGYPVTGPTQPGKRRLSQVVFRRANEHRQSIANIAVAVRESTIDLLKKKDNGSSSGERTPQLSSWSAKMILNAAARAKEQKTRSQHQQFEAHFDSGSTVPSAVERADNFKGRASITRSLGSPPPRDTSIPGLSYAPPPIVNFGKESLRSGNGVSLGVMEALDVARLGSPKWGPQVADDSHVLLGLPDPHGFLLPSAEVVNTRANVSGGMSASSSGVTREEYQQLCDRIAVHQQSIASRLQQRSPPPSLPGGEIAELRRKLQEQDRTIQFQIDQQAKQQAKLDAMLKLLSDLIPQGGQQPLPTHDSGYMT